VWGIFLDEELEPLQAKWKDTRVYPEPQAERKYPPMILK
jgi:hypothetical protein